MNTHELLIAARKKIERPECWAQDAEALDKYDREVLAYSHKAVKWSADGALICEDLGADDGYFSAYKLMTDLCGSDLCVWQDAPERTHAEVLKVFDIAIENTRGEG